MLITLQLGNLAGAGKIEKVLEKISESKIGRNWIIFLLVFCFLNYDDG